ncbi:nuclear receptor-interacting protein 1 [Latimeria chalumnae]|uniref:Nuclear receptor interacting protein 1 n=1 Tax=Latimeria chalumnae TaxID=7897 RepID=H3A864_LATCH|nr:PREDICTED: nuclear receptor-interacting protein 1 [Latimeria chalumnae]XP_014353233.1 PREDICTED: nuclear receptor-interacting protein 1 [Latimeria chalumnae]|eukprot:XP_006011103.1 PREDICTED: nuclear receptor-interacting protein 1 [Latimeria chalumnae]
MTHGEELGSEMQQDFVLTYYEGLRMHQATGGSIAAADKRSGTGGHGGRDQKYRTSSSNLSSCQVNGSGRNASLGSGTLHLKKARLLQSSEDWNEAKRRRVSDPIMDLNVKKDALLTGMVDSVPKGKQDSTLLASLLQSFSSRLQSVALSQQIRKSFKEQGYTLSSDCTREEADVGCYGTASSHLKALLKKSKQKELASLSNVTGNNHQTLAKERLPKSSREMQGGAKPAGEPASCAARLKAVASLVEKRSSPAPSPKPSAACSQLALLLSSEAHLQQYSREHSLKAQSANRSASERLAAMASQKLQENLQSDLGQCNLLKEMPGHFNGQGQTPSNTLLPRKNTVAFFQTPGAASYSSRNAFGCKSATEKNNLKVSGNSNSLLLHLLKTQNVQKQSNGQDQNERYTVAEDSSTPPVTDEYSDHNLSLTEESSDDDSCYSSCTPIDLSLKQRGNKPAFESASLEKLTESLLQNWNPKAATHKMQAIKKGVSTESNLKSHQKVTLLQLLLGHKKDGKEGNMQDTQGLQPGCNLITARSHTSTGSSLTGNNSSKPTTPLSTPELFRAVKTTSPLNLSHPPQTTRHSSPLHVSNLQSSDQPQKPSPKQLTDHNKKKEAQAAPSLESKNNAQTSIPFSASRLLQNLAQCGMQSPTSVAEKNRQQFDVKTQQSLGLFDRISSPIISDSSTMSEENRPAAGRQLSQSDPEVASSAIENLLEKRTVLQLLLATSKKGKKAKKQRADLKDESPENKTKLHNDERLNEQILTVQIKTEPPEYNPDGALCGMDTSTKESRSTTFQATAAETQIKIDASPAREDIKKEPPSPQNPSPTLSKSGLLSRLLRQTQNSYPVDHHQETRQSIITEVTGQGLESPCTVPKKRKFCSVFRNPPENYYDKKLKTNDALEVVNGHGLFMGTSPEFSGDQQEIRCIRNELQFRPVTDNSVNMVNEPRSGSKESKGFNVLKQLLLSENCVKDMSQPRNVASSADNCDMLKDGRDMDAANKTKVSGPYSNDSVCSHNHQNLGLDPKVYQYPFNMRSPTHSPFPEHLGSQVLNIESAPFNLVPTNNDTEGPIRWVIRGVDRNHEFSKDSPRLTRTNPILYYMLQKGAASCSVNSEGAERPATKNYKAESLSSESRTQLRVKEEPALNRETNTVFLDLRNSYSHLESKKPDQNLNGVHGILEKVLAIKREPD